MVFIKPYSVTSIKYLDDGGGVGYFCVGEKGGGATTPF